MDRDPQDEHAFAFGLDDLPAAVVVMAAGDRGRPNAAARRLLGELGRSVDPDGEVDVAGCFHGSDAGAVLDLLDAGRVAAPGVPPLRGVFQLVPSASEAPSPFPAGTRSPAILDERQPLPRFLEVTVARGEGPGPVVLALHDVTEAVRARQLLSTIVVATMIVDRQARPVWGPVGHRPESEEGELTETVGDRTHPEDLGHGIDVFMDVMETAGNRRGLETRVRHPSKSDVWHHARIEMFNGLDDPRLGGITITTIESNEGDEIPSLGHTTTGHLSVADAAPVGIIVATPAGRPLFFNEASRSLLPGVGVEEERDWTAFADPDAQPLLWALVARAADGERGSLLSRFTPLDGGPVWLMVTASPRTVDNGRLVGQVITLQDVTAEIEAKSKLEAAQERLLHLARHDTLTGLPNRDVLADALAKELTSDPAHGPAVLFCDLDGFKQVNDRHGHRGGDGLLALAAARLRDAARSVAPDALVARVGGDEFVVLLTAADGTTEGPGSLAGRVADALLAHMAEPFHVEGDETRLGVSIGIAEATHGDDADSIVQRADTAMYEAKASGRHRALRAAHP